MSERKTDAEFEGEMIAATSFAERAKAALIEARRARSSKVEKDTTIRALVDALEYAKKYVPSGATLAIVDRALLAAGRLP